MLDARRPNAADGRGAKPRATGRGCAAASLTIAALAGATAAALADVPAERFFVMGTGTLAVRNAHSGERAEVHYRRPDGSYDAEAFAVLRRLFRSRSDQAEHDITPRLVEILSTVQRRAGAPELVLVSGYRSPALNEKLRSEGRQAAGGSLHTEALAADVRAGGANLRRLWEELRTLDCCGVGLYEGEGFLHVDVGPARFWEPATSRVGENLSALNARVFARTEYDRYAPGEPVVVRVHGVTAPPVAVAREALLVREQAEAVALEVGPSAGDADAGCIEVGPGRALVVRGAATAARGRIELRTCEPRVGETPETVTSNLVELR